MEKVVLDEVGFANGYSVYGSDSIHGLGEEGSGWPVVDDKCGCWKRVEDPEEIGCDAEEEEKLCVFWEVGFVVEGIGVEEREETENDEEEEDCDV